MASVEHSGESSQRKMEKSPKKSTEKQTVDLLEARIPRVPPEVRELNKSAYTPRLVSIGPLHIHSMDEHLQSRMDRIKRYYVHKLLREVTNKWKIEDVKQLAKQLEALENVDAQPPKGKDPHQLAEQLKGLEDEAAKGQLQQTVIDGLELICKDQMAKSTGEAKGYYAEPAAKDRVNSEMLRMDGCFILELLRMSKEEDENKKNRSSENKKENMPHAAATSLPMISKYDPIFGFPMMRASVHHDLLLLENQVPFFVLEDLFRLTLGRLPGHLPLENYLRIYFQNTLKIGPRSAKPAEEKDEGSRRSPVPDQPNDQQHLIQVEKEDSPKVPDHDQKYQYEHILHFLHNHYVTPPPPLPVADDDEEEFMPTASDLDRAGVKFFGHTDNLTAMFTSHSVCHRARFKIPTLYIYDSTEVILRNFIAFEKCRPGVTYHYFTSYASLMDRLINTRDDVQVLEEAKVIYNKLGRCKDVACLFNNLCKEVPLARNQFLFLQECKAVAKYNEDHRSACLLLIGQYLQRRWSATPSTFIAFCVAILAFLMQVAGFITNYVR